MARKHQITLYAEFDEHDTPETKYIVIVDNYLPVATCRLYVIDDERLMLGRIVVLPEYRHHGLGTLVVREAEKWAKELGYRTSVLESRDNKIHFYETMGYVADYSQYSPLKPFSLQVVLQYLTDILFVVNNKYFHISHAICLAT